MKLRVLLATINADHPQLGMKKAFESLFGAPNVREFDYLKMQREGGSTSQINRIFLENVDAWKPEWIFLQVQETNVLTAETLVQARRAAPGVVITHWTGDCRKQVSPYLAEICRATDVTFVSSTGHLPMFVQAGAKDAQYLQIGVDWEEDVLGEPDWTPTFKVPDVVFCANFYGANFPGSQDRLAAVEALLGAGINIGVVGNGWPQGMPVIGTCHVKKQHHVWKRAKVALNINNFNDVERYYSDRQLIAMASGTVVVCRYIPKLEYEFLPDECVWYTETAQLVSQVQKLLSDDELRRAIGSRGRMAVLERHTWWNRLGRAFGVVAGILENK